MLTNILHNVVLPCHRRIFYKNSVVEHLLRSTTIKLKVVSFDTDFSAIFQLAFYVTVGSRAIAYLNNRKYRAKVFSAISSLRSRFCSATKVFMLRPPHPSLRRSWGNNEFANRCHPFLRRILNTDILDLRQTAKIDIQQAPTAHALQARQIRHQ